MEPAVPQRADNGKKSRQRKERHKANFPLETEFHDRDLSTDSYFGRTKYQTWIKKERRVSFDGQNL